MQLTNSATIVDFFPEAFIAESDDIKGMKVVIKRFIKRVYFRANGMKSYSTVVATDAKNEWASRIAKGAEVTDFNTDKMPQSEYMPLMCWLCHLLNTIFIKWTSVILTQIQYFHLLHKLTWTATNSNKSISNGI